MADGEIAGLSRPMTDNCPECRGEGCLYDGSRDPHDGSAGGYRCETCSGTGAVPVTVEYLLEERERAMGMLEISNPGAWRDEAEKSVGWLTERLMEMGYRDEIAAEE